jgi:hypothetical protein
LLGRRGGLSIFLENFDEVSRYGYVKCMRNNDCRLKPLLNRGEGAVLEIANAVCDVTGSRAFAKVRIADTGRIENSG